MYPYFNVQSKNGSSPYSSTSDLSDSNSTSSLQSLSQGSVPEILIGLAYNATTGRLDVEVIKGSHFKQRAAGRAPGKNFGKRKVLLGFASMGKGWYDGSSITSALHTRYLHQMWMVRMIY